MKKTIGFLVSLLFAVSAVAADLKLPPSALSDVAPNDLKVVVVAEFSGDSQVGQNPREMTVRELTSNRPTMAAGERRLCTVGSSSNLSIEAKSVCVSARTNPPTLKVATFKNATGAPINPREESRSDFYGKKPTSIAMAADGTLHFKCALGDNGRNTGTCRLEDSN